MTGRDQNELECPYGDPNCDQPSQPCMKCYDDVPRCSNTLEGPQNAEEFRELQEIERGRL